LLEKDSEEIKRNINLGSNSLESLKKEIDKEEGEIERKYIEYFALRNAIDNGRSIPNRDDYMKAYEERLKREIESKEITTIAIIIITLALAQITILFSLSTVLDPVRYGIYLLPLYLLSFTIIIITIIPLFRRIMFRKKS